MEFLFWVVEQCSNRQLEKDLTLTIRQMQPKCPSMAIKFFATIIFHVVSSQWSQSRISSNPPKWQWPANQSLTVFSFPFALYLVKVTFPFQKRKVCLREGLSQPAIVVERMGNWTTEFEFALKVSLGNNKGESGGRASGNPSYSTWLVSSAFKDSTYIHWQGLSFPFPWKSLFMYSMGKAFAI